MKEFTQKIDGVGYDGEGVCRVNGKVVFVPYALDGEEVRFQIQQEKSSFAKGKLVEVLKKSDRRTTPPCPYFTHCGGCCYQHTDYQNELEIKKKLLQNQFRKTGYDGEISIHPSKSEYEYRNKIKLFVGKDGLSLKEKGNLCHIEKCMLVDDKINEVIKKIDKFIVKHPDVYNEVTIREENNQILVLFNKIKDEEVDYQGIFLVLGKNCGIYESFQDFAIYQMGIKELSCEEMGITCHFSPKSFHQVNKFLYQELYSEAIDNIIGEKVINCYSGAGVLSGVISKTKEVVGIELGLNEHSDAERLKEENSLTNLTNLHGDCAELLSGLAACDTLITDPPRKGMSKEVIEGINQLACKRIIYISCDSATMVRDISRLTGYKITKVSLYDMFARTGEYETLAVLDRV